MTQQDQLQHELTEKNRLLNAAEQIARLGHWQWDVPANKITWSDNMYRIYGIERGEELKYENYIARVHPGDRQLVQDHLDQAFANKKFSEYYHRIILSNGTERTIHARGDVIVNELDEVIEMRGTGQDVTEQKKAEKELMMKTLELQRMNAELQEFAYIASHDLQEPLRKMTVFTNMLENDKESVISEKGKLYIDKIVNSSARMRNLIEDILQFSKLNAPAGFVPVDLNLVLTQVLSDMEVNITKSGAKIKVNPLPLIEANVTQMEQLFQNLISNAIKFRSEKAEIELSAEIVNTVEWNRNGAGNGGYNFIGSEKQCRIFIKDNGIGIDKVFHENIFTIFQRLNGKRYEGTGIGLAICKKIIDIHNGMIEVQSRLGEGSTFIVNLPLHQKKPVQ